MGDAGWRILHILLNDGGGLTTEEVTETYLFPNNSAGRGSAGKYNRRDIIRVLERLTTRGLVDLTQGPDGVRMWCIRRGAPSAASELDPIEQGDLVDVFYKLPVHAGADAALRALATRRGGTVSDAVISVLERTTEGAMQSPWDKMMSLKLPRDIIALADQVAAGWGCMRNDVLRALLAGGLTDGGELPSPSDVSQDVAPSGADE